MDSTNLTHIIILLVGYSVLLLSSSKVIYFILHHEDKCYPGVIDINTRHIGNIVGRCENLLIVTFMILGAYTALAIVFTAKTWVRREDMVGQNSLYFLAGTLINVTYSIAVGAILKVAITTF